MQRVVVIALCLLGLACKNDSSTPDAPTGKMDAAAQACTGMVYDACNPSNSNCMTGTTCKTFTASAFSVCTPTCSAQMPCPMQGSMAVTCNGMSLCKPNAPNTTCSAP